MNKFYAFLLLTILAPAAGFAQQNYKPGYVINLKGDTLKGQIDYREWDKNPVNFRFRPAVGAPAETFTINNARAFGINGFESYQAFNVSISENSLSLSDISLSDSVKRMENVFLKVLVYGDKANLYSYTDKIKTRFYFSEAGETPLELRYWVDNSSGGVVFSRFYRNQLIYLAQKYQPNNANVIHQITNAEYDGSRFVDIVREINNIVLNKTDKSGGKAVSFYLGAGISYSSVNFEGNTILASTVSNSVTPMPYATVGIITYANPGTRKLYIGLDVTVKAASQKTISSVSAAERDSLVYHQYSAALALQLGYNFYNTATLKVFGSVGAGANFANYKSSLSKQSFSGSYVTYPNQPDFQQVWLNPVVKAGVTLRQRVSICATYNLPGVNTNYLYYSGHVSGYQLGVNLMFGK